MLLWTGQDSPVVGHAVQRIPVPRTLDTVACRTNGMPARLLCSRYTDRQQQQDCVYPNLPEHDATDRLYVTRGSSSKTSAWARASVGPLTLYDPRQTLVPGW